MNDARSCTRFGLFPQFFVLKSRRRDAECALVALPRPIAHSAHDFSRFAASAQVLFAVTQRPHPARAWASGARACGGRPGGPLLVVHGAARRRVRVPSLTSVRRDPAEDTVVRVPGAFRPWQAVARQPRRGVAHRQARRSGLSRERAPSGAATIGGPAPAPSSGTPDADRQGSAAGAAALGQRRVGPRFVWSARQAAA